MYSCRRCLYHFRWAGRFFYILYIPCIKSFSIYLARLHILIDKFLPESTSLFLILYLMWLKVILFFKCFQLVYDILVVAGAAKVTLFSIGITWAQNALPLWGTQGQDGVQATVMCTRKQRVIKCVIKASGCFHWPCRWLRFVTMNLLFKGRHWKLLMIFMVLPLLPSGHLCQKDIHFALGKSFLSSL